MADPKITILKQWLHGCRKNNRRCQESLYRYYFPVMLHLVSKHTQQEDEQITILNNGFLKVFQKVASYKEAGSFEGWVRRIMYHSISDFFRAQGKKIHFLEFSKTRDKETIESDGLYFEELMILIKQLPTMQSKVFQLFAIEGYSHNEISLLLNINKNTSRWYLAEAKKTLRHKISTIYNIKKHG